MNETRLNSGDGLFAVTPIGDQIIEFHDITLVEEDEYWTYTANTEKGEVVIPVVSNPTPRELIDALLHAYYRKDSGADKSPDDVRLF